MGVWGIRAAAAAVIAATLYYVPLVRVVSLRDEASTAPTGKFNPKTFAESFWDSQLLPAIDGAADADTVAGALAANAAMAGAEYGVRVGVDRGYYLFLRGEGDVTEAGAKGVVVRLASGAEVHLKTGPLFGAAIRDAPGLLQGDEAPTSRDYNALANELNRIAEERVVPTLREARVGDKLRFAGCGKVADPARFAPPLELHPVLAEVE